MPELVSGKELNNPSALFEQQQNLSLQNQNAYSLDLFDSLGVNMDRVNSNYLMERANSNGLYGHRQISFNGALDNDLLTYLDDSSFLGGMNYTGKGEQAPIGYGFPYAGKGEVLPVPELESYVNKIEPKGEIPKIEMPKMSVVPQKNVKYYGLCQHKKSRETCVECQENRTPKNSKRSASGADKSKSKRRPMQFWTKEEDIQLWKAIEIHGTKKWMAIAKQVPGKDHKQCLQRWNKVLNPKLKKGRWKETEDQQLTRLVREQTKDDPNKNIKWNVISEAMADSRSAKQCRERWVNHLNPDVTKQAWTEEEDKTLLGLHEKFPNKWANISRCLPGRSESMVKSRLTKLTKMKSNSKGRKSGAGKRTRKAAIRQPKKKQRVSQPAKENLMKGSTTQVKQEKHLADTLQLLENNNF